MSVAVGMAGLSALFPFQIVTDRELVVVDVGPSLTKICPSVKVGSRLDECVRIVRPPMKMEYGVLSRRGRSIVLLETRSEKVSLRGQLVADQEHGTLILAVAPRVLEMNDLEQLGLTMHDFAPSDPVLDFLIVLQTKETILKDALVLNEHLKERQNSLEAVRTELVAEIDERQRTAEALREANEVLSSRLAKISEQEQMIARMSIPAIHVWEGVVTLPIVGVLDDERIQRLTECMLEIASRSDISIVIIDLTGIEAALPDAARHLAALVQIARLLGRRCLFSGVVANLARTLVEVGVDLGGLVFMPNVRSAISRAIHARVGTSPGTRA